MTPRPGAELRSALAALTTRGRCFASAGASAALAGLVLGEHDLVRIGVLLLALPLAATLTVARSRYRLSCTRSLDPPRVEAGGQTLATVRVANLSRLPTAVLLVEDQLPRELGTAPRFVLDRLPTGQQRSVAYRVRTRTRGVWSVGPLSVRLVDPFGFCELVRSFAESDDLVVTPVVTPLPSFGTGRHRSSGGEGLATATALGSEDDVGTRPYHEGDDLRRVHWRTTARTGELSVRQEAMPRQARATLLLDTRASVADDPSVPESPAEWAVSAAASVAVALARRGYALRLVDATGRVRVSAPSATAEHVVLTELAGLTCDDEVAGLDAAAATVTGMPGTLIALIVRPTTSTVLPLVASSARTGGRDRALALLVDGPAVRGRSAAVRAGSGRGPSGARELLSTGGWSVAVADSGAGGLGALWSELLRADAGRVAVRR